MKVSICHTDSGHVSDMNFFWRGFYSYRPTVCICTCMYIYIIFVCMPRIFPQQAQLLEVGWGQILKWLQGLGTIINPCRNHSREGGHYKAAKITRFAQDKGEWDYLGWQMCAYLSEVVRRMFIVCINCSMFTKHQRCTHDTAHWM